MSEYDLTDRTEEATPRRLEEAREKGLVARSEDLSTAIILLGGLLVLRFWGHYPLEALVQFTRGALGNLDARAMNGSDVCAVLGGAGLFLFKVMLPVAGALLVIALVANVVQTGFLFSTEPLTPKLQRLNPAEGMKRLVSRRGLVRLAAGLLKVAVVGIVAGLSIHAQFDAYVALSDASVDRIFAFVMSATFDVALRVGIALLALAVLDFLYQRWQYREDLRMTKQEVRDELKRMEGDPLMRDRRRRLQRRVVAQRMMHRVPSADVVVTGSGELALALCYDARSTDAPTVVAKGKGRLARRIVELAEDAGVPVVEREPLARALDRACDAGATVPSALYEDVAEVLAYVYEIRRMDPTRRAAASVA